MAGGVIGTLYVVGHVVGSPALGMISDRVLGKGIGRVWLAAWGLGISALVFWFLTLPFMSPLALGVLAFVMGVALHCFPLINATVAERWGVGRVGESLGWINVAG